MPAAWAAASASAIGIATRSTSRTGMPVLRDELRQGPARARSSMTMKSIAARGLDLVDRDDVGVVEGGGGSRFLDEADAPGLVRRVAPQEEP